MAGIIASKARKTRGEEEKGVTGEEENRDQHPQVWVISEHKP